MAAATAHELADKLAERESQLAHKQAQLNTVISERNHYQSKCHELEAALKEQRKASGKMIRDLQRELEEAKGEA